MEEHPYPFSCIHEVYILLINTVSDGIHALVIDDKENDYAAECKQTEPQGVALEYFSETVFAIDHYAAFLLRSVTTRPVNIVVEIRVMHSPSVR